MTVIHILALLIGALPVYLTLTGKITGSRYNPKTGETREGGWTVAVPAILGGVVMVSAGSSILERFM